MQTNRAAMDSGRWEEIQSIFDEAVGRSEEEQQTLLQARAGHHPDLVRELQSMLAADRESTSLLDGGIGRVAHELLGNPAKAPCGSEFGPYRLKRLLGEGGMGVVWLAERVDAGNLVAIKFLLHADLSPARRDRFGLEIRTLARLKHPFIARLYDAGTFADGTPWFVMEFVEGIAFAEYCRDRCASLERRIRLFRSVCEAVQYAHGQGVIHRDLKPSNILVERDGTPRLLDFGIAKRLRTLDESSDDRTRPGLRFLSQEYAAPEWIRNGVFGVCTDVYSLGVILYECLTDIIPVSCGVKPAVEKPSCAARGLFPLRRSAWNDLDVLCLTAMHPDVQKRYQSVEALIRDLDHYLKQEPLEARPESLRYRAGKFVARNRRAVAVTCVGAAVLIAFFIFFTVRLAKARNAAQAEAARTERVEQFMFNLFQGGDKEAGPTDRLRVVTLLDRGQQQARALSRDPSVQADLYQTLGNVYQSLGNFQQSDAMLQAALDRRRSLYGPNDAEVARSLLALGLLRIHQARLPEAEHLIQQALAIARRNDAFDPAAVATYSAALGRVWVERGQYQQAIRILEPAAQLQSAQGSETEHANTLRNLADAQFYLGHYAAADALNMQLLEIDQGIFGERHPRLADDYINLGSAQKQTGHYAQAERYFRQALEINEAWYGKDHPETARAATYVAQALDDQGHYAEGQILSRQALAALEHAYGKVHPRVALAVSEMGLEASQLDKLEEAEADYVRMAEIYRSTYGEDHQMTGVALANLATIYLRKKQYARAEATLREVIAIYSHTLPPGHFNVGVARIKLGRAVLRQKRYREAETETLAGYNILINQASPSITWLQSARQDLVSIYDKLAIPQQEARFQRELIASR